MHSIIKQIMDNDRKEFEESGRELVHPKKGDRVRIRVFHLREGHRTTVRVVKEIWPNGTVEVGMFGDPHFQVQPHEILEIVE